MKKLIPIIVVFLLTVIVVNGAYGSIVTDAEFFLMCDNATEGYDSSGNYRHFTNVGTVNTDTGLDGTTACQTGGTGYLSYDGFDVSQSDFTYAVWAYRDNTGGNNDVLFQHSDLGQGSQIWLAGRNSQNKWQSYNYDSSVPEFLIEENYKTYLDYWYLHILWRDGLTFNWTVYNYSDQNIVDSEILTQSDVADVTQNSYDVFLVGGSSGSEWADEIENIGFWKKKLSQDEIQKLLDRDFNESPGGTEPSCTITMNETNPSTYNYSYTIIPSGFYPFNITVESVNNSVIYNITYGINEWTLTNETTQLLANIDLSDSYNASGEWYVQAVNNNATCTLNVSNFVFDFENPEIATNLTNGTSYSISSLDEIFSIHANFTDGLLDGYILEIVNTDDGEYNYHSSDEGLTTLVFKYNISQSFDNITNTMGEGTKNFILNLTVFDSHNPINKNVRYLPQDFDSEYLLVDGDILFYGDELKLGDKYTFFYLSENKYKMKITFEEDSLWHTLFVNSSDLRHIDHSGYMCHFSSTKLRRYLDFDSDNIESCFVTEMGNGDYKIDLKLIESSDEYEEESIITNSMGDLNVVNEVYLFSVTYTAPASLSNILLGSIDDSLNIIEEAVELLWVVILILGLLGIGLVAVLNYNSGFGVPVMFTALLLMFRISLPNLSGSYWYIGYLITVLQFVGVMALFNMKSIRNRYIFHKK